MKDFTKGGIGRSIFLFGLPIILGNLFQQLYMLVNSAIVGCYLGDVALAAVGSVYPIVFFLVSLVIGIGSGGSVVVSHFFGGKKFDRIPTVISTFYIFFIIIGVVICGCGILFASSLFSNLGLEKEVMDSAVRYMRVYMIGMFFAFLFNSAVSILRGLGDSKTQLYYLVGSIIVNAVLSYVFVAHLKLSLVSTAWASVISQFLAFALLFIRLQSANEYMRIKKLSKYFDVSVFKEIVRIGLPTGIQQSIVALSQILILGLVAKFGTDALAAYSAASRIESVAMLFVLNFASALTSFAGQNYGAGNIARVKKGLYFSMRLMLYISVITFSVFFFFANGLMGLFSDTVSVVNIGVDYLKIAGIFWFLFAVMNIYTSFFRAVGYTFVPMIISLVSLLLIRLPLSYVLSFEFDTTGIWLGAPLSWFIGMVIFLFYYKKSHWAKPKSLACIVFLILCTNVINPQKAFAQNSCDNFLPPLTIPLGSSGHFGELRSNHFHSGIDLRTQGKENQYVICPFDGEVSRIKIQVYGGGKNLYISHTNGYTTVYMHLNEYYGKIGKYVKDYQYKNHCYSFDLNVPKGRLKLKKGDTIALSGNTGSSGGPHLHYEIRNTASQKTLNPVLNGLKLKDELAPTLYALRLLAVDDYSSIEEGSSSKFIDLMKSPDFKDGDTIIANGKFYLALEAYDRSNGSTQKNGVFDTKVIVNQEMIFRYNNSGFFFTDSRYANAIIDYGYLQSSGRRMLWTKKYDNCSINCVSYKNKGIIEVAQGETKEIVISLTDERGNQTNFKFYLTGSVSNPNIGLVNKLNTQKQSSSSYYIAWNKANSLTFPDSSSLITKAGSLYEDLDMSYSSSKGKYSNIHTLHSRSTPIHKAFTLKIRYNHNLNTYKDKAVIVSIDGKGRQSSEGGKIEGKNIVCSINKFGTYSVAIDTIAPKCKPHNFTSGKQIKAQQKTIQVKISDNLSGIHSYNAYLNGAWVLAEYDGKSGRLIIDAKKLNKGKNDLEIKLSDSKANRSSEKYVVIK